MGCVKMDSCHSERWRKMTDEPKYRDETWLREQYADRKRSTGDIAEECGCSTTAISDWLNRHGIETRTPAQQLPDERLTDSEWLREKYIIEKHTICQIADECGCCKSTVRNYLNEHGIDTPEQGSEHYNQIRAADGRLADPDWLEEQYVQQGRPLHDIATECRCHSETVRRWLDRHEIETGGNSRLYADERLADPEWLREKYVEERWDVYDIAEECGCHDSTVSRWLNVHEVKTRSYEAFGEDNPNWKGGPAPYGPGWNEEKRQLVRERDGYVCQDPGCSMTQNEHIGKYGVKLHVHHLRRARDVGSAEQRNAKENLITLCCVCHRRWEQIADTGLVPEVDE